MTAKSEWIVGAAATCDVVVDHPHVSGRHCRLSRTADGFRLEDLGSTNGTCVNGRRIDAPVSVAPTDRITLGSTVPLPWPREAGLQTLRIGRDPDNDVVIDSSSVSSHHAQIVFDGGQVWLEDLASTNGTALNSPANRIARAALNSADTVYLGSTAVPAAQLLSGRRPRWSWDSAKSQQVAVAAGVGVGLVLLVGVAFLMGRGSGEAPPVDRDAAATPPAGTSAPDGSGTNGGTVGSAAAPSANDPTAALYAVFVRRGADQPALRVGTAWAVAEHRLATTAAVVAALERLRGEFPVAAVRRVGTATELAIVGSHRHPKFAEAYSAAESARKRADALRTELDAARAAPEKSGLTQAEVDRKVQQFVEAEEQWFLATERQVYFDAGLLDVAESLPDVLLLAAAGTPPKTGASWKLTGLPFGDEEIDAEPEVVVVNGRPVGLPKFDATAPQPRQLTIACTPKPASRNWQGSPVLDGEGRVVALFSRPTPAIDPNQAPSGEKFDAASVEHLRSLLETP